MKLHGTMEINNRGHLCIGGCDTVELARDYGTPLYVMDEKHMRGICRDYYRAFTAKHANSEVIYASKAFMTMAMARIIDEENLGLDVVSGGELFTAIRAGFPAERVYFHGNNKSREEIQFALKSKIGRFVVDNMFELELLNEEATRLGETARILLRIQPGIEAHTHEYIRTGQIDSKFGMAIATGQAMEIVKKALNAKALVLKGLHCHIGSQIFEIDSFRHAADVMMSFIKQVKDETGVNMAELNLGGGFGIYYKEGDTPAPVGDFAEVIMSTIGKKARELKLRHPKVIVEPGRSIVGTAGTTLYTIGAIKHIPGVRTYVAVDGGMGDNPRPALYQAKYEALVANKAREKAAKVVSVTGKCCESGDMLIWDILLPEVSSGDILAVSSTGAYNYSMSSNYNRLPRPAVVLVKDGKAEIIVKRETYQDLVRNDVIPARLQIKECAEAAAR
ncbi:MAG: diaminopimelate decarboxylase [Peptococcaceae bacterium]|jgi:diaminopimelate decarboxylase|nr:diaminopimelate decarboxylase [Peptococcaceae bacterium]MDH7525301.1 diaminopimelate decarboxylase [Peptococcaceae bacterium]